MMKKSKWPCTELFSWILSVWTSLSILAKFWNSTSQCSMYVIINIPQPCYHGLVSSSLEKVWFHVDLKNEHFVLHMHPYFGFFPQNCSRMFQNIIWRKKLTFPFILMQITLVQGNGTKLYIQSMITYICGGTVAK